MTTCHDIQLYWELPSTAHFCSLFRAAFNLLDFDIEELEEAILTDGLDGSASPLVVELLVRLLQGCMPGRSVTPSNIDSCLRKLFRQKCHDYPWQENLFAEGDFRSLPLRRKVVILHTLCEFRLDVDDVHDLLKNLETESLRVEPLGFDEKGSTYWYFYGTRLYREDHSTYHPLRRKLKDKEEKRKHKKKWKGGSPSEENSIWQVECFTQEDWINLAERFEGCESRLEKQLLSTLKYDFLPEIPRLFAEKEKRRLQEFAPRRTSGRVQKLKEKKEEEKRLAGGAYDVRVPSEEPEPVVEMAEAQPPRTPERSFEEELLADLQENTPPPDKKRRSKKKSEASYKEHTDWHCGDDGEEMMVERMLVGEEALESAPKRKHKEKKSHHKKHNHRKKGHKPPPAPPEPVSDTSNKENTCVNQSLSEPEDDRVTTEAAAKPKVFGRKTNNSLASVAFSLTPSTVVPDSSPPMPNSQPTKKKVKSAQMLLQTEEELRTGMYKVLEQLSAHEDAWVFKDRVEESFAPNYYVVIRRPMYICKMEQKLDSGCYTSLSLFEADFKLMMDNCKLYNGPDSEYTHIAFKLEKYFAKLKSKYLVTEFSSDDEICIDMGFQQLSNRKKRLSKDSRDAERDPDTKKRGRKKKKVGRKPKNPQDKVLRHAKHKSKSKVHKNTPQHDAHEMPSDAEENQLHIHDADQQTDQEEEEEEEEPMEDQDIFQNDDYNMDPVLMVREDPFSKSTRTLSPMKTFTDDSLDESDGGPADWNPSPLPGDLSDQSGSGDVPPLATPPRQMKKKAKYNEAPKLSDSEYDSDHDVALLYYNNDGSDQAERVSPTPNAGEDPLSEAPNPDSQESPKKCTKHKSDSPKKKHKHHHRKHHHHKRKHSPSKNAKKVLSVDDVFDLSEGEPEALVHETQEPLAVEKEPSPHKKKHTKHKSKHERHHKHQKHKDPEKKTKKHNKKKSKSHTIKPEDTAALHALAEATEISLKGAALDAFKDSVPNEDAPVATPLTIDEPPVEGAVQPNTTVDDKKSRKRKKKHDGATSETPKKKVKKSKSAEAPTEKDKKSDSSSCKALFRDLKEGKIKPGAIIKSKDLAKKEGQVKKETKASADPKNKGKPNPFGKINKEENSKLGSLIAKAKESRIGLVPNSEVGDSPKLSLGSIILSGDIGSTKHSSHEPNSPEEEKPPDKYDSPWDQQWEKQDSKDESSQFGVPSAEEDEEYKEEVEEVCEESPETAVEEVIQPPPTPKGPEFKQEKVTPNLSAWFRAFGGPKLTSPRKRLNGSIDDEDEYDEQMAHQELDDEDDPIDVDEYHENKTVEAHSKPLDSPSSPPEEQPASPPTTTRNSSPEPPVSPVKPPDTPWYDKINDKPEEEPIWKKKKSDEDEDPYKFEEEELDRAREEAKKLEVERQRKASVSSSGLSDRSPLNIDSDRSPAFSSEGERSPMTRSSPAMRSPLTPGFGNTKQYSPVTEKSPVFSPRYDPGMAKGFSSAYDADKNKYPSNGSVKVGFYQDLNDKSQDKGENPTSMELKHKESPIYSPTVPYVSPYYNKESSLGKQKSPGRFANYYSSIDSSLDKPKTPGYYPSSAPSTPSDRPSPASVTDEKQKSQYNYYSYDPTKPLTDQYKNTGSSSTKPYYEPNGERSPATQQSGVPTALGSPAQRPGVHKMPSEKMDLQPPKKRPLVHRSVSIEPGLGKPWDDKGMAIRNERIGSGIDGYVPTNLAGLSQVVSRIPNPCGDITDKSLGSTDATPNQQSSKTVHPQNPFSATANLPSVPDGHSSTNSRPSSIRASHSDTTSEMQHLSHMNVQSGEHLSHLQPPPAAHQKTPGLDRPLSRNDPPQAHAGEKPLSYLHPKTMWTSSLPSSIASSLPSSLSSLTNAASMASFALAGQKGLASLSSQHLAHLDRAAFANLAGRQSQNSSNIFPHELLQRSTSGSQSGTNSMNNSSASMSHQNSGNLTHSKSSNSQSATASATSNASSANNFDLGMARSYASLMTAVSQSSTLFGRNENALGRSLSGSSSPFLSQSPGLGASLGMSGSSRTPTPAHQPSLNQPNFPPPIGRDPRDAISHSHPSLQIPSLNSISNGQSIGHLNTSNLGYPSRDSLALMNQGGRNSLVPSGTIDPQQFYTSYLQRHQQLAQEELLLRSAGMATPQLAAHQSMMLQHGLMPAGYPSGYPHSLGLRSGTYQGMTRPWI